MRTTACAESRSEGPLRVASFSLSNAVERMCGNFDGVCPVHPIRIVHPVFKSLNRAVGDPGRY